LFDWQPGRASGTIAAPNHFSALHRISHTSNWCNEVSKAQYNTPVEVTPVARKLAKEYKLDLATIQGSGPGGRITETDVQRAHAEQSMGSNETEIRLTGMRGTVAQRMYDSIHNSAQFTMTMQADVTELLRQREALKSSNAVNAGETQMISSM